MDLSPGISIETHLAKKKIIGDIIQTFSFPPTFFISNASFPALIWKMGIIFPQSEYGNQLCLSPSTCDTSQVEFLHIGLIFFRKVHICPFRNESIPHYCSFNRENAQTVIRHCKRGLRLQQNTPFSAARRSVRAFWKFQIWNSTHSINHQRVGIRESVGFNFVTEYRIGTRYYLRG